jgi:hypothetical protein
LNIFILDNDIQKCAEYHVDKHVVKMPLEALQLLCDAYYHTGQDHISPYKKTHYNHPCAKWVRQSLSNWLWLYEYGQVLFSEYTYRYNKIHACESKLRGLIKPDLMDIGLTMFAEAMPNIYKNNDPVIAYRKYYNGEKRHLFSWKNRNVPEWIEEN